MFSFAFAGGYSVINNLTHTDDGRINIPMCISFWAKFCHPTEHEFYFQWFQMLSHLLDTSRQQ